VRKTHDYTSSHRILAAYQGIAAEADFIMAKTNFPNSGMVEGAMALRMSDACHAG
jgi:hypothetical protein